MKEYIPNPVDTGHIQLPKELEYLVEEMAKNVHEVWSKTRIEQGWTYGKKRFSTSTFPRILIFPTPFS